MVRSQKRQRWIWLCVGWGTFWTLTLLAGNLFAVVLAPISFLMILFPVGMSSEQPSNQYQRHDPEKWGDRQ